MPRKYTYNKVKEIFENENWKLISTEYKNNSTKLDVICDKGHKTTKMLGNFIKGDRCAICSNKVKYTYNKIKQICENNGFKLLSSKYTNNETKLKVKCSYGHITEKVLSTIRNGNNCSICDGNIKYTYSQVKEIFEKENWKLLSKEYKNCDTNLNVLCNKGHQTLKSVSKFLNGRRCIKCNIYKNEEKCRNVLQQYFNLPFDKIRPKWLNKLELDGYNEDLKFAFEYQGKQHYEYHPKFFHKKNGIKDFISQHCRDKIKKNICKEKGIQLLIISYKIQYNDLENFIHDQLNNFQ